MEAVVPPYPPPPRQVPPDLGRRTVGASSGRLFSLSAHLVGLSLFVLAPLAFAILALWSLLAESVSVWWRAIGFIVFAGTALVYLKSLLPRRVPLPPGVIPVSETDQPTAYAFIAQVATDIGAPKPRGILIGSGVELGLSSRRSFLDLVRIGNWDIHVGLWLWNALTLSEFQAVVARSLAPLAHGRVDRWRFALRGLLQATIAGDDFLDEMADSHRTFAGVARLARSMHDVAVFPLRRLARVLLRLGRQQVDSFADDLAAVRIAGSDSLVHAVLRADFAGAALEKLDVVLLEAAVAGFYSKDLYSHAADAAKAVWEAHNDFTLGQPPTLRSPTAGKYADVFEPGQAYLSAMWKNQPPPGEREQHAKKTFVASERDERPANYLLDEPHGLRQQLTRVRYVEVLDEDDDFIPFPPAVVTHWLATHDQQLIHARYTGCYDDGRAIQPGTPAELDAALRSETWEDGRLLSNANALYLRAGERAARWRSSRTALSKVLRRTVFRATGRDRALADDLADEVRKSTRWLNALDRWAYVIHTHMAARLPDLDLHEALVNRYESVLRFQPLANDPLGYRNRVSAFVRKLEEYPDGTPAKLAREAKREFKQSQKDLESILDEAAEIDDPLLAEWTGGVPLDRFLFSHERAPARRGTALVVGRRMLRAWDEILAKGTWLHLLGVASLLAIHQQIVERFMTQAVATVLSPEDIPEAILEPMTDEVVLEPLVEKADAGIDFDPNILNLEVENKPAEPTSQAPGDDPWGGR